MKTNAILVTALVLGTSSAAMAAPSFTVQARFQTNAGPIVRDHRTPPSAAWPTYVTTTTVRDHDRDDRFVRDHRAERTERTERTERYDDGYRAPVRALPSLTGPTWDCHNWDPSVDTSSVCAAYASTRLGAAPMSGFGVELGVRDAAIPDHQGITVDDGRRFHQLVVVGNNCAVDIGRLAIRFMDGSVQVVNINQRLHEGQALPIRIDGGRAINQIGIYTPAGARGAYTVFGR